ncbi:MAG TPA: hypothetical protein VFI31_29180, partial [Pirellulales bacterium]|nr:hypothetical protein [Pirellulales bacterium]
MRSVPQAMIWEMWRHGGWILLLGLLGANLLPAILFAALRMDGAVDPRDPSQMVMHVVLVQINMFVFAAAIFTAQGSPSRLYALPVTTASIVVWHLLPMMVLMALETAVSTVALNALFDLGWPVWGPAFFAAVTTAAVAAMFWLTDKSGWVFVGLLIVPAAMGLWFKSRYGEVFSPPTRLWYEVTFAESVTM